jgi:hypothetical protein
MARKVLSTIRETAAALARAGGTLSGEAAAHVHLAAATGSRPDESPRYIALPPRRLEAVFSGDAVKVAGLETDTSPVAEVVRRRLDLFATSVLLADGTSVPTLTKEAVAAGLLAQGGFALALLGTLLRVCPPIDPDDVREILKAARQGDRFQPFLELLDVA